MLFRTAGTPSQVIAGHHSTARNDGTHEVDPARKVLNISEQDALEYLLIRGQRSHVGVRALSVRGNFQGACEGMALLAPSRVAAPIVQQRSEAVVQIARSPAYKEFADQQGMDVDIMDSRSFQAPMRVEFEKWKQLVALAKS
jgi:hypothetical protein